MGLFDFEMSSAITVNAPGGRVWAVFSDAARWPAWCRVCVEVTRVPGTWAQGEMLSFKLHMPPLTVPFDVEVVKSRPGELVSWASTKKGVTAVRTISFTEEVGGVTVVDHKAFTSRVLPVGLYYPRFLVRRMTRSWLADLKAESERAPAS